MSIVKPNRKERILIEVVQEPPKKVDLYNLGSFNQWVRDNKHQFKNRFSVHLFCSDAEISPTKIAGFQVRESVAEGILTVKTSLCINEWYDDFKQADYVKIFLYDLNGAVNRFMEYNISYVGHRFDCEYKSNEIVTPIFDYEIF